MGRQEKIAKLELLLTRVQARAQEPRLRLVSEQAVPQAAPVAAVPVAQQAVAKQAVPVPVVQAPISTGRPSPVPVPMSGRPSPVPAPAPVAGRATPVPASPSVLTPDVIRADFAAGTVAHFVGELRVQTLADILREALKAS
jgi:hypothetical protein